EPPHRVRLAARFPRVRREFLAQAEWGQEGGAFLARALLPDRLPVPWGELRSVERRPELDQGMHRPCGAPCRQRRSRQLRKVRSQDIRQGLQWLDEDS